MQMKHWRSPRFASIHRRRLQQHSFHIVVEGGGRSLGGQGFGQGKSGCGRNACFFQIPSLRNGGQSESTRGRNDHRGDRDDRSCARPSRVRPVCSDLQMCSAHAPHAPHRTALQGRGDRVLLPPKLMLHNSAASAEKRLLRPSRRHLCNPLRLRRDRERPHPRGCSQSVRLIISRYLLLTIPSHCLTLSSLTILCMCICAPPLGHAAHARLGPPL